MDQIICECLGLFLKKKTSLVLEFRDLLISKVTSPGTLLSPHMWTEAVENRAVYKNLL